jgi:hypothetical protein
MSSNTWTPDALRSSARALQGLCWRVVEAQSQVSTMKLSDTLEEQAMLERLIEQTKPPVPEECRHLGYLLATPFRYAPYPQHSRFRRAGSLEGVLYGAQAADTAIAEKAFYRLLFYAESPDTPWPANPGECTAFAAEFATAKAADLTRAPLAAQRERWTQRIDYTACHELAHAARAAGLEAIRYASVRDPAARPNLALLTCRVFTQPDAVARETWRLHFSSSGVRAMREFPAQTIAFDRSAFAADPRIAALRWDR